MLGTGAFETAEMGGCNVLVTGEWHSSGDINPINDA